MARKARRGVPDECQSRVEVDRDPLATEIPRSTLDISPQELAGRWMRDHVDRLGKVNDHRAVVLPENVESREVAVHELGVEDQSNLTL